MATTPLAGRRAVRRAPGRPILVDALDALRPWALPLGLVAYVLTVTWSWEFPDWRGVPFAPVYLAGIGSLLYGWSRVRGRLTPMEATAIIVVTAMAMTGVKTFWTQPLRDLELYVKAGDRWLAGAPVYIQMPLTQDPQDLSLYPFLYPPVTLPLFGALSLIPFPLAAAVWTAGSLALFVAGLHLVGIRGRWIALLLLWPPVVQGLYVGNVAVPLFVLFAVAPWRGAGLVVAPLFKLYSGLATLWLVRRERLGDLVRGALIVAAMLVLTLPVVRPSLWAEWIGSLEVYRVSQSFLPSLFGFGLGRYLPVVAFGALVLVVLALAFVARDPLDRLARLGVAVVVASPSLFSHGFIVALPALARLATPFWWLALGITAVAPGIAWFAPLALVAASWFRADLRRPTGDDPWHPLGAAVEPWPEAPGR